MGFCRYCIFTSSTGCFMDEQLTSSRPPKQSQIFPIGSMGLVYLPTFTIFYPLKTPIHVGKYASPMDGMGFGRKVFFNNTSQAPNNTRIMAVSPNNKKQSSISHSIICPNVSWYYIHHSQPSWWLNQPF